MSAEHQRPWQPLSIAEVAAVFREAPFPWWIAGGHAIDHFLGYRLRTHGDTDVLVLARDKMLARQLLANWDCWAADVPGSLRPWPADEILPPHIHDIWCRKSPETPWRFQLMLDESAGENWVSRRCTSITRPINTIGTHNADGIPFLAIEVQLFYKANAPREKDELDFNAALPLLSPEQLAWLETAIDTANGPENEWLRRIRAER